MSLANIRVLDLSRIISGPFCSQLLADLGATVTKVEPPKQGDPLRHQGVMVGAAGAYFANYNRGKRSIALDLYRPEGKGVLERLIGSHDVLLENFRPGILERMGLTRDRLRELNPDLVHCNINGFGVDGPYAERPAFDFVIQAMSGFMDCNGTADGEPLRSGVPIADLVAGLFAALAVAAAVADRKPGEGRSLSVSMLAAMMNMLSFRATDYLNSGVVAPRTGNDHGLVAPYGIFATQDRPIAVAPSNDAFYHRLLQALDLEEVKNDLRFVTNALRVANREAINGIIERRTLQAPSATWIDLLNRAGVPCSPVPSLAEAFEDAQVVSQGIVSTAPMGAETLSVLASPIRDHDSPAPVRLKPAPLLGEHGRDLLAEVGYSDDEIEALLASGAVEKGAHLQAS